GEVAHGRDDVEEATGQYRGHTSGTFSFLCLPHTCSEGGVWPRRHAPQGRQNAHDDGNDGRSPSPAGNGRPYEPRPGGRGASACPPAAIGLGTVTQGALEQTALFACVARGKAAQTR